MNLSALKTFAPAVRRQLMEAVTRKLDFVLTGDTADLRAMSTQRATLRRQADQDRQGLIERISYTWFNRFTALRFIDAHGWHPFGARVLTGATAEDTQPELLRIVRAGQLPADLSPHTNPARLNRLLDGALPSTNPQGEVYRHLVLAACRFYHALLPNVFEKLDDETELLLPDDLLTEHSVVHGFRTEIGDADCAEVEILGWLYQFYISEKKDQVMARKSAVPTEDIPAVTQLFTPHWIVRYLVENSLGRLWLLNRPQSRLRARMPYYIEGEAETDFLKIGKPEEIKLLDPAAGSAHMLTYGFDLLYAIYEEEGYAPSEIPALILRHNLHGLEICPRASQLAELALLFKAREKSRRFFQPEHLVRPRILELRDVHFDEGEVGRYIRALNLGELFDQSMLKLLYQFEEAKNFGSLIQPCLEEPAIAKARRAVEAKDLGGHLFLRETHLKVLRVFEQAEALTQRYHIVVANPPYMGSGTMNAPLKRFLSSNFTDSKADLFAAFISRNQILGISDGYIGMITMHSWMFNSAFQELRQRLIEQNNLATLSHLGPRAFDTIGGEVVQTVAFVVNLRSRPGVAVNFIRLMSQNTSREKELALLEASRQIEQQYVYTVDPEEFKKIPDSPIAYWIPKKILEAFTGNRLLGDVGEARGGMQSGDNYRFLRRWHEVPLRNISLHSPTREDAKKSRLMWFPLQKGGKERRWYGNNEFVVNWQNDGEEILAHCEFLNSQKTSKMGVAGVPFYFRRGVTWNRIGGRNFMVRFYPEGMIFDIASPTFFTENPTDHDLVGCYLNSNTAGTLLECFNQTISIQPGVFENLPFKELTATSKSQIRQLACDAIELAKRDWDNFETSWDFRDQPLLRPGLKGLTLEASWRNWEAQSTAAIRRMQELETENNRLFIAAYGLDGELQPAVPEEQITLARADVRKDIAAFLSYAVGCMMGRYSLDQSGLILANAGDTLGEFLARVGRPQEQLTFAPDADGIIPVLDGEWFEDDIVARTRDLLRATFDEDTLNENLGFIEESLGKDLRKYFLADFYKNHLQIYKKRPIYWLFRSPKGGFAALVYLHRMTRDTPNLVLNRYLRNYLVKLRARIEHLDHAQAVATTAKEKTAARKESDQLKKTLRECEDWERDVLLPLAQSRPELDLDDGVKVNYLKLGDALAPIPGLAAAEDE
jgi:hypothetical protein